jgi:hypothetical protein
VDGCSIKESLQREYGRAVRGVKGEDTKRGHAFHRVNVAAAVIHGKAVRYVRARGYKLPCEAPFTLSGIRVFGRGDGAAPSRANAEANITGSTNAYIRWQPSEGAVGYIERRGPYRGMNHASPT